MMVVLLLDVVVNKLYRLLQLRTIVNYESSHQQFIGELESFPHAFAVSTTHNPHFVSNIMSVSKPNRFQVSVSGFLPPDNHT